MRPTLNEVSSERLRAQYAELLRLRAYVQRVENLRTKADPDGIADRPQQAEVCR